jgi:hypothetical protein
MPPFLSLVRIDLARQDAGTLAERLGGAAFEFWEPDDDDSSGSQKRTIWVRTKKISELKKILAPLFHISRARRGYPSVTVWHD